MKCCKAPADQKNQTSIAPWEDDYEGFQSSQLLVDQPMDKKEEEQQHRVFRKLTNTEGRDKFILKRNRRNISFKKERYRVKLNTLVETQQQIPDVPPSNQTINRSRPQTRFIQREITQKKASLDISRFSTITVQDVSKSLKNTIKFFKSALQNVPQDTSMAPRIFEKSRPKAQTKKNKQALSPEKATIVMPVLNLYSLPSQQLNLYSFSFFRNSKLTQSCDRKPRKSILLRNLFPTIS